MALDSYSLLNPKAETTTMPRLYKRPISRRTASNKAALALMSISRANQVFGFRNTNPPSSVGQAQPTPKRFGAEFDEVDTVLSLQFDTAGALGNCVPVSLCAQGLTVNTRKGNAIIIKDIYLSGEAGPGVNQVLTQGCRLIVFWDRQPNGAAITAAALLNTTDVSGLNNNSVWDRFKIIYDKRFKVAPANAAAALSPTGDSIVPIQMYKKFGKGIESRFNGAGGAIGQVQTNVLYVCALGDQGPAALVNPVTGNFLQCRVRFQDA